MKISQAWLEKSGFKVKDTSKNMPYDFEATREDKTYLVEVKGTTSDFADAIAMTHGEVAVHRGNVGQTALMLVTKIRLNRSGQTPQAAGGQLEALVGWNIDDWLIEPTAFRVSRASS